jgi:SulP family sulfate permease
VNVVLVMPVLLGFASLWVEKKVGEMTGEEELTSRNRELAAQGLANSFVSLFGGIPGAQATIRSVLILNEGATTRLAGVMVGAFVIVELLLFQDWIALIPKAVFTGVLIKVGYDVFDWRPLKIYWREVRGGRVPESTEPQKRPGVTHLNVLLLLGTTLVTVLINLNVAVVGFCVIYYLLRWFCPIHDLEAETETEGFADEG